MRRTLLIGNGLNRCLIGGLAWGDLLRDIAAQYGLDYCADIPMPMEFERLLNGILRDQPADGRRDQMAIKQILFGETAPPVKRGACDRQALFAEPV